MRKNVEPLLSRSLCLGLGLFVGLGMPVSGVAATSKVADYTIARVHTGVGGKQIRYRLFVPRNYDPAKAYPIMVTLHGAGERGTNNTSQLAHGFSLMWADSLNQSRQQAFVLAPQCSADPNRWVDSDWSLGNYNSTTIPQSDDLGTVVQILDSLIREFHIDTLRQYVSGISMGGYGTWDMLVRYPKRFAAAVPVCGGADTSKGAVIKDIPIWAFHAANDPTVPVKGSRDIIAKIRAAGGTPKYTEYAAGVVPSPHESWKTAEQDSALVPWVQAQARTADIVAIKPVRRTAPLPAALMPQVSPNALGRRDGVFPGLKK
jgi:predicted peptidase